eukprot:COSAG01_NODE_14029_length_1505_cov_1.337127_3_plen_79_part_00
MMIIVAVAEIPLRLFSLHCSSDQVGILEVGDVVTVLETRFVKASADCLPSVCASYLLFFFSPRVLRARARVCVLNHDN